MAYTVGPCSRQPVPRLLTRSGLCGLQPVPRHLTRSGLAGSIRSPAIYRKAGRAPTGSKFFGQQYRPCCPQFMMAVHVVSVSVIRGLFFFFPFARRRKRQWSSRHRLMKPFFLSASSVLDVPPSAMRCSSRMASIHAGSGSIFKVSWTRACPFCHSW